MFCKFLPVDIFNISKQNKMHHKVNMSPSEYTINLWCQCVVHTCSTKLTHILKSIWEKFLYYTCTYNSSVGYPTTFN